MTVTFKRVDFRHSQASAHMHTHRGAHAPHTHGGAHAPPTHTQGHTRTPHTHGGHTHPTHTRGRTRTPHTHGGAHAPHTRTGGHTHPTHTGTAPPPEGTVGPEITVCLGALASRVGLSGPGSSHPLLRLFSGRLPPATRQLPSSPHLLCIPAIGKWRAPLPFRAEPEVGHRSLGWTESHGHSY